MYKLHQSALLYLAVSSMSPSGLRLSKECKNILIFAQGAAAEDDPAALLGKGVNSTKQERHLASTQLPSIMLPAERSNVITLVRNEQNN